MTYCPICGTKNVDNHQFCIKCGASLGGPEGKMPKVTSFEAREPKPGMIPPVTRAYWVWLLLMILLSGIFNYIYLYLNFDDLNKIDAFKPVQQEGPSLFTKKGTVLAFIILSAIIPVLPIFHCILIYWKYQKLNSYLNAQAGKQYSVPNSAGARLTLLIFQYLFTYGALALYIVMMIQMEISLFDLSTYDDLYLLMDELIIYSIISSGLSFASLGTTIGQYLMDYKWQQAMNERTLIIYPQAVEKTLF